MKTRPTAWLHRSSIMTFLIDSIVAYFFAMFFLVPWLNVMLLRQFLRDSKDFGRYLRKKDYVGKQKPV